MADWNAFTSQIKAASERQIEAARAEVDDIAEQVLSESKELCPVSPTNAYLTDGDGKTLKRDKAIKNRKTGKLSRKVRNPLYTGTSGSLRDSGTTTGATVQGDTIRADVGFNADHAAAVHERTNVRHGAALKAAFPGANIPNLKGQAKYLAVPMIRMRRSAMGRIAGRMANAR
jgi:hypothetical protein